MGKLLGIFSKYSVVFIWGTTFGLVSTVLAVCVNLIPISWDTVQALIALFASVTALIIATYHDRLREFGRPKEKIIILNEAIYNQQTSWKSTQSYTRLAIYNDGDGVAESVEVTIEKVSINHHPNSNFVSTPIRWTHLDHYGSASISPKQSRLVDLCYINDIFSSKRIPRLVVKGEGFDEWGIIYTGVTNLQISISLRSGYVTKYSANLYWQENRLKVIVQDINQINEKTN